MTERIQRRRVQRDEEAVEETATTGRAGQDAGLDAHLDAHLDALLDEIDLVLESDAEEYVRGFVQKGGQ
jgi:ubiquitin-like protein Pup